MSDGIKSGDFSQTVCLIFLALTSLKSIEDTRIFLFILQSHAAAFFNRNLIAMVKMRTATRIILLLYPYTMRPMHHKTVGHKETSASL